MQVTQKIITQTDLEEAIRQLEDQRREDATLLKHQFKVAYQSVNPINLIRSTLNGADSSGRLKGSIVNVSIGLAAGILSKVLFAGISSNVLRKLAGTVLMFGITNLVTKNGSPVKLLGRKVLRLIRDKRAHPADR